MTQRALPLAQTWENQHNTLSQNHQFNNRERQLYKTEKSKLSDKKVYIYVYKTNTGKGGRSEHVLCLKTQNMEAIVAIKL